MCIRDRVQVGLLAHLHDCDTEGPEHGRGAAVLLARFPVARLGQEGLPFHGADAQAADDDVDVDVPGTIVDVYKRQCCIKGSVADDRKVGLGHGNLAARLLSLSLIHIYLEILMDIMKHK